jgi:pseudouridine-5'-phosphate glycosidase/pseudouridine kinase
VGTNVVVFDKEAYFPGFFTRRTQYKAPFNSDSLAEITRIISRSFLLPLSTPFLEATDNLKLSSGTLIACPLPEEFEAESDRIEQAVEQALREAR